MGYLGLILFLVIGFFGASLYNVLSDSARLNSWWNYLFLVCGFEYNEVYGLYIPMICMFWFMNYV